MILLVICLLILHETYIIAVRRACNFLRRRRLNIAQSLPFHLLRDSCADRLIYSAMEVASANGLNFIRYLHEV